MPMKMAEKALQESRSFGVRRIPVLRPLGWLARGWKDLMTSPVPGLLHGLGAAAGAALAMYIARDKFWLLVGLFSAFLIVAPILATGLYQVSRRIAQGEKPGIETSMAAWKPRDGRLVVFGVLLGLTGFGWMVTSASLIIGFAGAPVNTPLDFLKVVVLAPSGHVFEAWLGLGALLAAPVFASTVMAIPLLLDRHIGILGAIFTSWRVVMEHPAPLALWAALLMGMTLLGMVTVVGLVVIVPWLAHASWHVYRDTVDTSGLSERS